MCHPEALCIDNHCVCKPHFIGDGYHCKSKYNITISQTFYQSVLELAVLILNQGSVISIVGTKFTCFHGKESHRQGHVIDADAILNLEKNTGRSHNFSVLGLKCPQLIPNRQLPNLLHHLYIKLPLTKYIKIVAVCTACPTVMAKNLHFFIFNLFFNRFQSLFAFEM